MSSSPDFPAFLLSTSCLMKDPLWDFIGNNGKKERLGGGFGMGFWVLMESSEILGSCWVNLWELWLEKLRNLLYFAYDVEILDVYYVLW